MKRFELLILAAFFACALTISTFEEKDLETNKIVKTEQISAIPVVNIAYAVNEYDDDVPLEFSGVNTKTASTMVYLKSSQLINVKNYTQPNTSAPVKDFAEDYP